LGVLEDIRPSGGTTTMKDDQTAETDATIPLPEGVRLAMDDIAGTMREGLWRWP